MLPDDVLVEIFNSYVKTYCHWYIRQNAWHALVLVCRRWRYLVFASPRSLNLRLDYSGYGPMSEMPDAWPVLPVILVSGIHQHPISGQRWDNMVSALESEHYNRICEINIFRITESRWERFVAAMQKSFPELTSLDVGAEFWDMDWVPVLPDSFLGRSAPRLRSFWLERVPFPSLPKLLLSANGLVSLTLDGIPDSGYFSPDAIATALRVTTKIEYLELGFLSPRPLPDPASRPLSPPTRFVLPSLTEIIFKGVYEYLEDILSRFDAPLLYDLTVTFFNFMDLNSDIPQLHRLINHAEGLKALGRAVVWIFCYSIIELNLHPKTGAVDCPGRLMLHFNYEEFGLQLWSLAQICSSSLPLISALEELEVVERDLPSSYDMDDTQWLEFLDPFTSLKDLYLTDEIARRVCNSLQELSGEMATEVLPALRNLFVAGSQSFEHIQEAIRPFIAARQLSGHPVAISHS